MPDAEIKYVSKTVTTVRGLEARSIKKAQDEGWELVSETPARLMRTTLTFRKPRKPIPRWAVFAGGGVAAAIVIAIVLGSIFADGNTPQAAPTTSTSAPAKKIPSATLAPTLTPTPAVSTPAAAPVTDAEVTTAFNKFIAERASANVFYAKAVSQVAVTQGTVVVTFDPAAKGLDGATFDSLSASFNFGSFLATPVAFNDDEGNRLRPAVTTITAIKADGTVLGTIDHQGILDLNGLTK